MASIRRVMLLSLTLVALVLIACGVEPKPPASSATPYPTATILISREEAIDIALTRMVEGVPVMSASSPVQNPRDVTVRFMHVEEYANLGGGSGSFSRI
jgi:hypothetical protein